MWSKWYRRSDSVYTILRYGSIYGPRANLKNGLHKIVHDSLKKKKLIYRGTKKAIRSFIHVKDAAKSSVEILNRKFKNKIEYIEGSDAQKLIPQATDPKIAKRTYTFKVNFSGLLRYFKKI